MLTPSTLLDMPSPVSVLSVCTPEKRLPDAELGKKLLEAVLGKKLLDAAVDRKLELALLSSLLDAALLAYEDAIDDATDEAIDETVAESMDVTARADPSMDEILSSSYQTEVESRFFQITRTRHCTQKQVQYDRTAGCLISMQTSLRRISAFP